MSNAGQVEDPMGQFAWFDETLGKLQQDNVFVWIVGHIAPAMEFYNGTNVAKCLHAQIC